MSKMLPLFPLAKNFILAKIQGTIYTIQHYLEYLGYRHYSIIDYPNGMNAIYEQIIFSEKSAKKGGKITPSDSYKKP